MNELLDKLRKNGVTMSMGPSPSYHVDITLVTFEKDSKKLERGIITHDIRGELMPDSVTVNILNLFLDEFLSTLMKSGMTDLTNVTIPEFPAPKKSKTKDKNRGVEGSWSNPPRFNSLDEMALYYK